MGGCAASSAPPASTWRRLFAGGSGNPDRQPQGRGPADAGRAGRSGHQPGAVSRILCVPTHAFELVEFPRCARQSRRGNEAAAPLHKPLDVLAQHLVTVALGNGFVAGDLLAEVRTTHAYAT